MTIIASLIIQTSTGILFDRDLELKNSEEPTEAPSTGSTTMSPSSPTEAPSIVTVSSYPSTEPSRPPPTSAPVPLECIESRLELRLAIDEYLADPGNPTSDVALRLGYPIGTWCVGKNTDFRFAFSGKTSFNESINDWDMSNALDIEGMFMNTRAFNQPLDAWDVSKVTDMRSVFSFSGFNQPLADWDVSKVTSMHRMFSYTPNFDQSLNTWMTDEGEDRSTQCVLFLT